MPIQSRNRRQQRRRSLKMRGGEEKDIMDKLVEIEGKIDGLNTLIMQHQPTEAVPEVVSPVEEKEVVDTNSASSTGADTASEGASSTGNGTDGASSTGNGDGTDDASGDNTGDNTDDNTDDNNDDTAAGLINSKEKLKTPEMPKILTPGTPENKSEGGRRNSRRRRQKNNRKSQRRQRRR